MNKTFFYAACLLWGACACSPSETDVPLQGKLKREVVSLAPKVQGRVARLYVHKGQAVSAGDTLAFIELPELQGRMAQADGSISAAQAQLQMARQGATAQQRAQVEAACQAAKEQYDLAQRSHERASSLHAQGYMNEQKYQEVLTMLQLARTQLAGVEAKRAEVAQGARTELRQMAQGQLRMAQGSRREVEIQAADRYLLAPEPLRISSLALQEGELAQPGYNLLTAYALQRPYFRFTVLEPALADFHLGQQAHVQLPDGGKVPVRLVRIKELPAYAKRTSMNPEQAPDQLRFELKYEPLETAALAALPEQTAVTLLRP